MFVDFQIPSMRLLALISHFLLTTGLYWTKFDCLQISMSDYTSDHEYTIMDQQFTGLISFGLVALLAESLMFLTNPDSLQLGSVLHLGADCAACFWISWMILDGLDWKTYVYIFVFCVLAPVSYDVLVLLQSLVQKKWSSWHKPESLFVKVYYGCFHFYRRWCVRR